VRQIRRIIEEGRAERLRASGFDVTIVQYVPSTMTPDNLLLIATRTIHPPPPRPPPRNRSGLVLQLNAQADRSAAAERLACYLLEERERPGGVPLLSAWVACVPRSSAAADGDARLVERMVVAHAPCAQLAELRAWLRADALSAHHIAQVRARPAAKHAPVHHRGLYLPAPRLRLGAPAWAGGPAVEGGAHRCTSSRTRPRRLRRSPRTGSRTGQDCGL
jgi:hypothetical protein